MFYGRFGRFYRQLRSPGSRSWRVIGSTACTSDVIKAIGRGIDDDDDVLTLARFPDIITAVHWS